MTSDRVLSGAHVPRLKITRYLLCFDNGPEAAAKAAFFVRFGFDPGQPEGLASALRRHAIENPIRETWADEWGVHFEVDGPLDTPDGRAPMIRTSWMLDPGSAGPPRLITAFPIWNS